jgi:glutamate/tyrosine decarboxylase-like PLP-dependent enzyme
MVLPETAHASFQKAAHYLGDGLPQVRLRGEGRLGGAVPEPRAPAPHDYACSNWTGYTAINATVQSTKSAAPIAAARAVMQFLGEDGCLAMARRMRDATRRVIAGIEAIPELRVLGRPDMNLLAVASDRVSVFHVIAPPTSRLSPPPRSRAGRAASRAPSARPKG